MNFLDNEHVFIPHFSPCTQNRFNTVTKNRNERNEV